MSITLRGIGLGMLTSALIAQCSVGGLAQTRRAAPPPPATSAAVPSSRGPRETDTARLPVRRVVLYKSGVGYFEHVGRVRDDQTVSIDLTSGQLDDVVKSLTTADLGEGRVTGITFNSTAPLEQRPRRLGLPLGAATSPVDLLQAVRGARVEVQTATGTVTGRVLSVQEHERRVGDRTETVAEVTIVTEASVVRTVPIGPGNGVRFVDADVRGELAQYLDLIGSARTQDVRRLRIATAGSGARDLFVSYVSEVPVWKSTYRLVIPAAGGRAPFLQGWAIVDNTLGEDWTDVQLSLVAGAPQSFVQQLSQPLYTRRPVVPLPTAAMLTPQTHDGTLTEEKSVADASLPGGALGGVVGGLPSAPPPPPPAPAMAAPLAAREADAMRDASNVTAQVEARLATASSAARGADLGDLFEYALKEPITVRRNQSALVPIVQASVTVERVSLWREAAGTPRPLRAVWLTNDTGLTLDGGSLSLVEGQAFAGEGLLDAVQPGEKRLISYAVDLAARVTASHDGGIRRLSRMRMARGTLTQVSEERDVTTYTVRNEDAAPRTVVIEHPKRDGWRLAKDAPVASETTANVYRFRVVVPPGASEVLKVEESREVERRMTVSTITNDQVTLVLTGRGVDAGAEAQLRAVISQNAEVQRLQALTRERRAEVERITQDQARVRENLAALKSSAEERQLVARYATQLGTQEDRLATLRREIDDLETQRARAQEELVRLANAVTVDVMLN